MQSLEYLLSVNQLNLSDILKSILQDNEIYCLNDYFEFAIEISTLPPPREKTVLPLS